MFLLSFFLFFFFLFSLLGKAGGREKGVLFCLMPCKEVMTCCFSKQECVFPTLVFVVRDKRGNKSVSLWKGITVKAANLTGEPVQT